MTPLVNIFQLQLYFSSAPLYLQTIAGNQRACCFPSANFLDNAAYHRSGQSCQWNQEAVNLVRANCVPPPQRFLRIFTHCHFTGIRGPLRAHTGGRARLLPCKIKLANRLVINKNEGEREREHVMDLLWELQGLGDALACTYFLSLFLLFPQNSKGNK